MSKKYPIPNKSHALRRLVLPIVLLVLQSLSTMSAQIISHGKAAVTCFSGFNGLVQI